jgi:hypothetical protein
MGGACRWCFLAWSHRTNLLANSKGTQKDYPYEPQNILVADHFYVCRRGRCCSCRLRAKSGREVKRGFQCGLFSSLFPCCFPGNAARNGSSVLQRLRRSVRSGHEGRSRGDVRSRDDRCRGAMGIAAGVGAHRPAGSSSLVGQTQSPADFSAHQCSGVALFSVTGRAPRNRFHPKRIVS